MKTVLTIDYELFGSGRGDIQKHLVGPTNRMLSVMDRHGVKATFFVEQLEVKSIIDRGEHAPTHSREYKDAELLRNQIIQLVKEGHDIQLHLHPQWYGASFESAEWKLNFNWWRFSALPYRHQADGTPGRYDLLVEGKKYLEDLIRPTKPDYECIAFRAGGYNIGVDDVSGKALLESGFKIESSICPGFYSNSKLSKYDYTSNLSSHPFSFYDNGVDHKVIELPLLTLHSSIVDRISLPRLYAKLMNSRFKSINYNNDFVEFEKAAPVDTRNNTNSNFDVCLSSRRQMHKFFQKSKVESCELTLLIAHPKDYSIFSPLNKVLGHSGISFETLSQVIV